MQIAGKAYYVKCKDYNAAPMFLFCHTQTRAQPHGGHEQLYSAKEEYRDLRRNACDSTTGPDIQLVRSFRKVCLKRTNRTKE